MNGVIETRYQWAGDIQAFHVPGLINHHTTTVTEIFGSATA